MADLTPHYQMILPDVGGSVDVWGGNLNEDLGTIDTQMYENETVANWAKDTIQGALEPDYDWQVDGDLITRLDETEPIALGALQRTGYTIADPTGGMMEGRVDVLISTTKYLALGSVTGVVELDAEEANYFQFSMSGDLSSLSMDNMYGVADYVSIYILDITSNGFVIPTSAWADMGVINWAYGVEPTLSTTGGTDIITLITRDGGSTWTGALSQPDCQ